VKKQLTGLIAATFTPMHDDSTLNLNAVEPMVKHLLREGVGGLYVVGSTGEGVSLTGHERRATAEAFVAAADGQVPVVVQVGHNSLTEARQLATHAQQIGATAISAVPPSYFKIDSVETLVSCMAEIACVASSIPFYYYHVPHLTGCGISMLDFLRLAGEQIPTLAGIKYTATTINEMQACIEFGNGQFEILHGVDEMLLSGLAVGVGGAVGSTYNYAAPLYRRIIQAFTRGDLEEARFWQGRVAEMVRVILQYRSLAGQKAVMAMIGLDCGPTRLPVRYLTEQEQDELRQKLTTIGYYDWVRSPSASKGDGKPHVLKWLPHQRDRTHDGKLV
jgi:N-acetylneuraminate lyase